MTTKNEDFTDLMDLDFAAAASNAKEMELFHHVTGEPLLIAGKPITFSLLGAQSKEFRAAYNEQSRVEQGRRKQTAETLESREAKSAKLLSHATVGWKNVYYGKDTDGKPKPLPFTRDNAEMLYRERSWIREQVDAFVADEKNFWTEPKSS